ncbi:uncharacterized protein KY384_001766 [Bacidia gigantensis]|uniref:uncharacterized protein n=1 Tax=Bacidia gigantensis TaxID=2732470 RepID=UPI001D056ED7|nr:uncharacterized protein KY384_001766 [Bacidia gigantensis]KAG8532984.1 hypothetical protein KY384_001766 [Bacidia gigantensis]
MAIRWADCRLKYDEAVDILAGSGIMKNQDFDGMTAQWDDKPSQVYYEFKSQQQPNLIWRVGMNTRNVDFKPNEAPKAVSDADGGVKGDFADPSWFDTLASVDGKDVDSEGVAAA